MELGSPYSKRDLNQQMVVQQGDGLSGNGRYAQSSAVNLEKAVVDCDAPRHSRGLCAA